MVIYKLVLKEESGITLNRDSETPLMRSLEKQQQQKMCFSNLYILPL